MRLRDHIPPILHNAFGTLLAAAVTALVGLGYAVYTHSRWIAVPLWLLIGFAIVVVSGFTFTVLRYRRIVKQLTSERDRLQGKVQRQEEATERFRYPKRGWMSGFKRP
jgi:hypothetical protein